jgi:hypothetical protein
MKKPPFEGGFFVGLWFHRPIHNCQYSSRIGAKRPE